MPYREIIAVCSQIHTKHLNTICGQTVEILNTWGWRHTRGLQDIPVPKCSLLFLIETKHFFWNWKVLNFLSVEPPRLCIGLHHIHKRCLCKWELHLHEDTQTKQLNSSAHDKCNRILITMYNALIHWKAITGVFNSDFCGSRNKLDEWPNSELHLLLMNGTLTRGFYLFGSTSFDLYSDVIVELAWDSEHVSGLHLGSLEFRTTVGWGNRSSGMWRNVLLGKRLQTFRENIMLYS